MKRCRLWFVAIPLLACSLLLASGAEAAATNAATAARRVVVPVPPPVPAELPVDAVQVEILDGLPDESSWNFSAALTNLSRPPEQYTERVFGFAVFPTRYSGRGIKVDRPPPFLFRASARVTLPKGEPPLVNHDERCARIKESMGIEEALAGAKDCRRLPTRVRFQP